MCSIGSASGPDSAEYTHSLTPACNMTFFYSAPMFGAFHAKRKSPVGVIIKTKFANKKENREAED